MGPRGVVRSLLVQALAGVCLLSRFATAQDARFEGQRIVEVRYDPAKQPVDPRDLAQIQPLKAGQTLSSDDVADAIDELYATGYYDDIQIEAEPGPGGVIVRVVTKQRWFVGHVGAEGKFKLPPNPGQITSGTQLSLGMPFTDEQLKAAQQHIQQLFESNGLYKANVETQVDREPSVEQINFTFTVKAGKRARYEQPAITGNDRLLSDAAITRATGWRYRFINIYKTVTDSRTRGGVTGVLKAYQGKDRLMAKARITAIDYDRDRNRVKPSLEVEAGPKVNVKAVEAKVPGRTLKRYVPIFEERRVDRDLIVEGARNLRDYFQAKGYYDVDVDFRQRQEQDNVTIEYVISRGQRFKLVKVNLDGNKYFNEETLRERMFLMESSFRMRHGRYSEVMRRKDEENLTNLYKSNGFHDVKVSSTVERNVGGKDGDIAVTMHIEEGPQWFVDRVDVNGIQQLDLDYIRSLLSSLPGQPYTEVNVAVDRSAVLTRYYAEGFPDATFLWRAYPSDKPNHMNVEYTLTEGDRKYVRDVIITGIKHTNPKLVNNHIKLKADDPLALTAMGEAQRSLYDLGIFAKVDTAIQNPAGNVAHKYVLYDIEEANRYTVNIGLGAEVARIGGTTTNLSAPVGGNGFSPRVSADITRLNFLGRGHIVTLRGRFSSIEQMASFNYVAPRFQNIDGRNITFTLLYDKTTNVRTFSALRQEASLQISQQFTKATNGLFRLTYRRVSTSDIVIPALLVPALLQPVRLGFVSANLVQDRRNNPTDPRRGVYNTAEISLASKAFASQRSFLRTLFRDATYHPINRNWTFARQTTFGLIFPFAVPAGVEASQSVPLPERFFGGGGVSHRGFPENQAGPRDIGVPAGAGATATQPTGFPLGGNAVLFNTLELRFPLIGENIGGVLFHDAGNVYRSISDISFRSSQRNLQDFDYMVHAVGFGIRYKTPVGPVRVDLSYAVNPPSFFGFKGTVQDLLQCNPNLPQSQLPAQCQGVQQNTGHFQFFFSIGQTF